MNFKSCLLIFTMSAIATISCKSNDNEALWEPDIYVGKSNVGLLHESKLGKRVVKQDSAEFGEFFCMKQSDMERIHALCLRSEK